MGVNKELKNDKRPRSKGTAISKTGKIPFSDFRFVRIELTSTERDECRAMLEAGEFKSFSIDDYVAEGYKVSFSRDEAHDSTVCSVSQPDPTHQNAGLILTGRGSSATTALGVVSYKSHYLCEDTLWREAESRRGGSYNDIG